MKKILFSAITIVFMSLSLSAQNKVDGQDSFKPNGKPLVTIFSDLKYSFQNGKSTPAFELSRSYFGYVYNFSPNFSSKVVFDVANSGGLTPSAFTAFVKNAYVEYGDKLIKVNMGMVGTNTFSLQESTWGKRYLLKSFQDQNGFSSSADLGASVKLQFTPELSLDAQLLNGEGFQKVQADSALKVAVGLTYEPVKHLLVRVYGDYMNKTAAQTTFNAFIAYTGDNLTLAGEYNLQNGHAMVANQNYSGVSFWGTYKTSKIMSIFARYDNLSSNVLAGKTNAWNASKDGQLYTAGLEFFPVKGISISPNFQYTKPNLASLQPTTNVLVNVGISF
jgi:hypothetical protein